MNALSKIFFPLVAVLFCACERESSSTVLTPSAPGTLNGKFSISATQQVRFSRGNLQYQASTGTWRFAEHQWDIVGMGYGQTNSSNNCYIGGTIAGSDNWQISETYSGWIDLFGWGTGADPAKSSKDNDDYSKFTDWGTNQIGSDAPGTWRKLTKDEWAYLFTGRANASSKYGVGKVNGITGMILLPDEFTVPIGLTFNAGEASSKGYQYYESVNNFSESDWTRMENSGAVFLPCAGHRYGTDVYAVGVGGSYWSASQSGSNYAYSLYFGSGTLDPQSIYRFYGLSVRLVSGL